MHTNIYELERLLHEEIRQNRHVYELRQPAGKPVGRMKMVMRLVSLALLFFMLGRFTA